MSGEPLTLYWVIKFPYPWPDRPLILQAQHTAERIFTLQALPTRRLDVSIVQDGKSIAHIESCRLRGGSAIAHILNVQWDGSCLEISIDGSLAGSTNPNTQVPAKMRLGNTPVVTVASKREDFSRQNADILLRRKNRVSSLQALGPSERLLTKDEDFQCLADEIKILRDDIEAVFAGKVYKAKSVARSLRWLLEPMERRMGVLQRCAGRIGESLTVYTLDNPSTVPPVEPDMHLIMDMRADQAGVFRNPVDIDVWLGFRGGRLSRRSYSHGEIIKTIGNTRAAHGDHGLPSILEALDRFETEVTTRSKTNFVVSYVLYAGREVMLLAEKLIEKNAQKAKGNS
jgi:hypothetical protein